MRYSKQKGFTLIELMIVVAIVGILAAVAMPAYQNYLTKSKFTEVVAAAAPLKLAVELCAQDQSGIVNCSTGTQGVPVVNGTRYVQSGTVSGGAITLTAVASEGLNGATYILTPTYTANSPLQWTQNGTCVAQQMCK